MAASTLKFVISGATGCGVRRAAPCTTKPIAARGPTQRAVRCLSTTTDQVRATAAAAPAPSTPSAAASAIAAEFAAAGGAKERLRLLLDYARALPPLPEGLKVAENRVMGCTAQAWVHATLDASTGAVQFAAGADSELTAGLAAVLVRALSGLTPAQVLEADGAWLRELGAGLGASLAPSRTNGWLNMLEAMKRRARMLAGDVPRFPSLLITADALEPQGAFAEAQAQFLQPDQQAVERLAAALRAKKVGVVAHYYMDPEVQGVLSAAAALWPHIHISDSLVMADAAVAMAEAGCEAVAVLGVDFMSENVRAILDEAGHRQVGVYRMSPAAIGCSLAEAAESATYEAYLSEAAATPTPNLHVVYINTSLRTKAFADAKVPTITCTSSNVVQTILQAFAQVPDLTVWYGPDTYMGRNLAALFAMLADSDDATVAALHPAHTAATVRALLPRLRYFEDGTCIVHHVFGGEVAERVREGYGDAYLTAHFEVPGEMFSAAMAAKSRGMGVVGSTSNILDFIAAKLEAALAAPRPDRLAFVLGTEAGMITSIVRKVQAMMAAAGRRDVEVEVVFPVASSAITTESQARAPGAAPVTLPAGLAVAPGPAGGDGCGLNGGCAACPYMKMNTLAALEGVVGRVGSAAGEALLEPYKPRAYAEPMPDGRSVAAAGCVPILHMRDFTKQKALGAPLVADIERRAAAAAAGRA